MARDEPWAQQLADALLAAYDADIPDDVLGLAALHLLDSIACAAGAHDADPVELTRRVIAGSGPAAATVWFSDTRASVGDAVLANGTAVRFLDANDIFLGSGPGGHPSDNIPVAVAVAELTGAVGRDVLAVIALSYELVARLRRLVFRTVPRGPDWHEISISGPVAAAMTALLAKGNRRQVANAISIGAARGYALKEIRRGQISMLKAAGNAMVAREGVLAGFLAMEGMVGPAAVFEGRSGLITTLGGRPEPQTIERLCAPPEWAIRDASIKPYPALGTSQAAVWAAAQLAPAIRDVDPSDIIDVTVRLPDVAWTREYIGLEERRAPDTRGSADHSIQYLVTVALRRGEVAPEQYDEELWRDAGIRQLMRRVSIEPDADLVAYAEKAFPAVVEARLADGRELRQEALRPPGSPLARWGRSEVVAKLARLDRVGLEADRIERLASAALGLAAASDVGDLAEQLR